MAPILRGDVVWADLNPVRGHEQAELRPVVVVSKMCSSYHRAGGSTPHGACHLVRLLAQCAIVGWLLIVGENANV